MSSLNPEKWQAAKEIFYAALRRAPAEREQFLNESCKDDDRLRSEVESPAILGERKKPKKRAATRHSFCA